MKKTKMAVVGCGEVDIPLITHLGTKIIIPIFPVKQRPDIPELVRKAKKRKPYSTKFK